MNLSALSVPFSKNVTQVCGSSGRSGRTTSQRRSRRRQPPPGPNARDAFLKPKPALVGLVALRLDLGEFGPLLGSDRVLGRRSSPATQKDPVIGQTAPLSVTRAGYRLMRAGSRKRTPMGARKLTPEELCRGDAQAAGADDGSARFDAPSVLQGLGQDQSAAGKACGRRSSCSW